MRRPDAGILSVPVGASRSLDIRMVRELLSLRYIQAHGTSLSYPAQSSEKRRIEATFDVEDEGVSVLHAPESAI